MQVLQAIEQAAVNMFPAPDEERIREAFIEKGVELVHKLMENEIKSMRGELETLIQKIV
jgi:hypothetical protein